jgi:hypothetical protein
MRDLPQKACWRAADVGAVISNEALEGHEGIFLATHSSISGFDILGSHAGEIEKPNERAVLTALSDKARHHAFCVVQGEPGSGKSHLIRWLSVNWPAGKDVKLLLQRADGSLEGALTQLKNCLPAEFKELFDNLGQRHRATEKGRANMFRTNLANALDPDHFDPPLDDVSWCKANMPTELVGHFHLQRWNGPTRVLRLLEGKGREEGEDERNSASANFDLFDLEELADCCGGLRGSGVLPATEKLAYRLIQEAKIISQLREANWTAEEIELDATESARLKTSIQLMSALNKRRNDAIQNVLGVSAEGLKKLFRQVREALARKGHRLVLLLEDITSWEGIDDSLIDVLVTNAETRRDSTGNKLCPLISVVGVTPAYYQKLHGNYRSRITHELNLGKVVESSLQDVATLRDRAGRLGFATRYLSAVRAGEQQLNTWREALKRDHDKPPPNPCRDCKVREGCHAVFGHLNGVGFFPFTADSLERLFSALNDHDNGMTWKTPRGVLQAILNPNLSRPGAIEEGEFPTALLENKALVVDSRYLSPLLSQVIRTKSPEDEQVRLQRTIAYWGNKERAGTTLLDNGELAFAEMPHGVFEAFDLTWIGGQSADAATSRPETVPEEGAIAAPSSVDEHPDELQTESNAPKGKGTVLAPPQKVATPPSKRKAPSKSELERLRIQLRGWAQTGALESPSDWNKSLHAVVQGIDPRSAGLDAFTFRSLLTPERVKIEGTAPAQRSYFSVKREPWVMNGFEGLVALRLDKEMSSVDAGYHRSNLSVMVRHLQNLVGEYADKRMSLMPDGCRWSAAPALVQILMARSWLRGVTVPEDSVSMQLRAILSDEPEAKSDLSARCTPWRDFLEGTNRAHIDFRTALREMLATPQGGGSGSFGLADLSVTAAAIQRFRESLRFDPIPAEETDTGVREFQRACEIIRSVDGSMSRLLRIERDQLKNRAEGLRKNLRGQSIRAHLERLDKTIEAVATQLSYAAPDRVKEWKGTYQRAKARIEAGAGNSVEDLLATFAEEDAVPESNALLLSFLAKGPAADLEELRALTHLGEQVVSTLLAPVEDCVREGRGTASLEQIQAIGRNLLSAANRADPNQGGQ